uniref:uncharacterized protein n=1 Tax=Semicossyphus pulcher TaxID=241346 RepID=UPI0037E7E95A
MTPPNFALYFTCLFVAKVARTTALKPSSLQFESVHVGGSVTLQCVCQDNTAVMFYWYKQTFGQTPKLLSTFYKHNDNVTFHDQFKNNPRFSLDTENRKYHLKISDFRAADSATYICVGSNLYNFEFCEGITVSVKSSNLNIQAIDQSGSETIQAGGSVTLNCTVQTGMCNGQHSVYWFKNPEESHPGLIYTHGDRNEQCERKPNTQTHTCVYNLPMTSLNLSHAGTYYCAVASCGHILFGNGTKLDFEGDVNTSVLVYFLSTALAFTIILVILLAVSVHKMKNRNCQCKAADSTLSTTLCQDADNLHYAALSVHRANRSRRQRDDVMSECVYSSVRQ